MKVYELFNNIEFQNEIIFCYFDYENFERVIITKEQAINKNVKYIYVEADELYIEVDNDKY